MVFGSCREIGILLQDNQRQHSTLHIQEDLLPYVLCYLLCPVSAAPASMFRMDSTFTSYVLHSRTRSGCFPIGRGRIPKVKLVDLYTRMGV